MVAGSRLPEGVGDGGLLVLRVGRGGAEAGHHEEGEAGEDDLE